MQPLCSLCLRGYRNVRYNNHRDTENTEVAQKRIFKLEHYEEDDKRGEIKSVLAQHPDVRDAVVLHDAEVLLTNRNRHGNIPAPRAQLADLPIDEAQLKS